MRSRHTPSLALLILLISATAALAMTGGSPPPPSPPPTSSGTPTMETSSEGNKSSARQEAEQSYALAYEEVGKAKKDLEDGKAKNAEKRFRKALERCEQAVALDENYHEAWNLVGYTSRKLGDYDKAFKAYDRCLSIQTNYAPAREYLGEAWLEKGDVKKAREQLTMLEHFGAAEEAKTLKVQIDAWAAAHPDSSATTPAAQPARADSAAGSGAGR